jgi:uncharacterized protein YciI
MMHVLICTDRDGALDLRLANRDAHLAYLKADGHVVQAGPFVDAEGKMCGSLIVFDTEDRAHVEAFAEGDPYAKAGLFADVRIETWNRVIGG